MLELLIVLAIMGLFSYVAYSGFRSLTSAALVEDTNDLVAVMRRTQALAVESGVPVRVVFDLDKEAYWVEVCSGGDQDGGPPHRLILRCQHDGDDPGRNVRVRRVR